MIHSKQIEGVVDKMTNQFVAGEKTFTSPTNFLPAILEKDAFIIRIDGSWIYWTLDINNVNRDGNFRIGVGVGMVLIAEVCKGGTWEKYSL